MQNPRTFLAFTLLVIITLLDAKAQQPTEEWKLFYLGGQSNMDGYGYVNELPDSLNKTYENVYIFHGNMDQDGGENGGMGIWTQLKPGHGTGFSSDGKKNNYSDRFGVELSFADFLIKKYPNQKIAIIKYSKGGTSIDSTASGRFGSWDPDFQSKNGINQYDHFLSTLRHAFAKNDIDEDGKPDNLVPQAILWMQGESDGHTEAVASRYYQNLKRLMGLQRAALRVDNLPIIIGKISDSWNAKDDGLVWDHGNLVQHAQEKFVREDPNAAIVRTTRYYKYSDPWHYDSAGYIDLGFQFALEWYKLAEAK